MKIHVQYKNKRFRRKPDIILADLIQNISSRQERPFLVTIGGPGGSGKSTFAKKLASRLKPHSIVLPLDDYKTPRALRSKLNVFGPHPRANEMELIKKHFQKVSRGKNFDRPVYDKKLGKIHSKKSFHPRKITIIEGEVATFKPFRPYTQLSIFIDANWKTLLKTRINRDITERGYDKEKAITTFLHSNLKEFQQYGADSKKHADIHIYCDDDYDIYIESIEIKLFEQHHALFNKNIMAIQRSEKTFDVPLALDENKKIDIETFADFLQALFHEGVHRIIIGHYCAEGITLTRQEHKTLIQTACKFFPGEIITYLQAANLIDSRALILASAEYGADRVIVDLETLTGDLKEAGIERYKNALLTDAIPVQFTINHNIKLKNNPLGAKIQAQKVFKGFPLNLRPPF
ncbi:MAG: zeta toxin family protein [Candidatus Omnitrophica bacterium]|nr:zeta toxin family protein [Candidatus Omnitrophota bacterium]